MAPIHGIWDSGNTYRNDEMGAERVGLIINLDEALLREGRRITGLTSDRELLESGLRTIIQSQQAGEPPPFSTSSDTTEPRANPIRELLDSDFIACATTDDTDLSRNYKAELATFLKRKHGHR